LENAQVVIEVPKDELEQYKEKIAAYLYRDGVLSAYQARLIVGITRREFEQLLAKYDVVLDDLDETN
jgi:hypothetical protein